MTNYKPSLLIIIIFALVSNITAQTNYDCMLCHEDAYRKSSHRGDSVYVYVDKKILPQSVHKDVRCISCHKDAAGRFPHSKKLNPINCGNCHKEQLKNYNADLHGQAFAKGDKNAPNCKECHGDHAIFPSDNPKSRTNKINIPMLCSKCHKDSIPIERGKDLTFFTMFDNFSQDVHGQGIQHSGLKVTATCNDCHSNHNVYKQTNPLSKMSKNNITKTCTECHGRIEDVHRKFISKDFWKSNPNKRPSCSDCHISHKSGSGKFAEKVTINNFCVSTETNTWKCNSCHTDYIKKDKKNKISDYKSADCIVCNDTTIVYERQPIGFGFSLSEKKNTSKKAYSTLKYSNKEKKIGKPQIEKCGNCHFYGGGGDNVKHGDLSSDLYHADKNMDVHMDKNGTGMGCVVCHETESHNVTDKLYNISFKNENRATCEQCHDGEIHENNTLNKHSNKISCQTCHIPTYAKGVSTNMNWDWSTAGRVDAQGKQIKEFDSLNNVIYKSSKGNYTWATNVKPEYVWFNGIEKKYILGDEIKDTSEVLKLNTLFGSYNDNKSKIIPVKIQRRKQIFDTKNKTLITPYFYGHTDTAFCHGLDWQLSATAGMKEAGLPYSGDYSFINTEIYYPLNHMVSPVSETLKCIDCHSKESILKGLNGFYMPGRDRSIFDILSILMIIGAIGGIAIHSTIRILKSKHIL